MRGFPGQPGQSHATPGEFRKVFPLRLVLDRECLGVLGMEGVLGVVCLDLVVKSEGNFLAAEAGDANGSKPVAVLMKSVCVSASQSLLDLLSSPCTVA